MERDENMNHMEWNNVLLTSEGFFDSNNSPRSAIIERFKAMLGIPVVEAKALFIPTAALTPHDDNRKYAQRCKEHLLLLGVLPANIVEHDIDGSLSEQEAMVFDVVLLSGGNTPYLAKRMRKTGFGDIVKKMVYTNKVYIGISAGSMIAMQDFNIDNLPVTTPMEFQGLGFINVYFTVHCLPGTPPRIDLPLPHIALTDNQAIAVSSRGYEIISATI